MNELQTQFPSLANLYAVILNSAGQAWNTSTGLFETFNSSNWTSYAVSLTEQISAGVYIGNFPAAITIPGTYNILLRQRGGSTPAITDSSIGSARINWSGSAEIPQTAGSATLNFGSFK